MGLVILGNICIRCCESVCLQILTDTDHGRCGDVHPPTATSYPRPPQTPHPPAATRAHAASRGYTPYVAQDKRDGSRS